MKQQILLPLFLMYSEQTFIISVETDDPYILSLFIRLIFVCGDALFTFSDQKLKDENKLNNYALFSGGGSYYEVGGLAQKVFNYCKTIVTVATHYK